MLPPIPASLARPASVRDRELSHRAPSGAYALPDLRGP